MVRFSKYYIFYLFVDWSFKVRYMSVTAHLKVLPEGEICIYAMLGVALEMTRECQGRMLQLVHKR